jgi:prophage regulatory protein
MNRSIQRLPEVKARTGLSRSTIYLKIKDGSFPSPIQLSTRAVGWPSDEIDQWIEERITRSRPLLAENHG